MSASKHGNGPRSKLFVKIFETGRSALDQLYWLLANVDLLTCLALSDKTRLWYRDEQQNKLWFEVGTEVVSLKAFSRSSQTGM